jgi:fibronectin type 3 domain-containing protein
VTGETGFSLQRYADATSGWTAAATLDPGTTSTTITSLTPGKIYQYRIQANNASGGSGYSTAISKITIPSAPTSLTATAVSPTQINLAWVASTGAASYSIDRSSDGGTTWAALATTTATVLKYANTGLTTGTTYTYRVHATNASGTSDASDTASDTPTTALAVLAPSGLSAQYSSGHVALTWNSDAVNQTGFAIQRSTNGTTFADLAIVNSASATGYTDAAAARGGTYYYRIEAFDPYMRSTASDAVRIVLPPPDVTIIKTTSVSTAGITIAWGDVAGETGFKIERSTDAVNYTQIGTTATKVLAYIDSTVSASTRYYYRVRATNSGGDANTPVALTVMTPSGAPPASLPATALGLFSRMSITTPSIVTGPDSPFIGTVVAAPVIGASGESFDGPILSPQRRDGL